MVVVLQREVEGWMGCYVKNEKIADTRVTASTVLSP